VSRVLGPTSQLPYRDRKAAVEGAGRMKEVYPITPVPLSTFHEPEISFAGEVPLPPNVRPVILLKGSDYDLGYQYYQQLVQIFGRWVASHHRKGDPQNDLGYIGPWFLKEMRHVNLRRVNLTS